MTIKVGGGAGAYPVLEPDATYVSPGVNSGSPVAMRTLCGFDMNGDEVRLPTSYTGEVYYYDSAGNVVSTGNWSTGFVPADADAAGATGMVGWTGFHLSDDGSLLYFMGLDNINTWFLGTINKAGVINILGSATHTESSTAYRWPASNINRAPDGTGNIFLRANNSIWVDETEINISTGAVVSPPNRVANLNYCFWKTPSGVYTGQFNGTTAGSNSAAGMGVPLFKSGKTQRVFVPYTSNVPAGYTAGGNFKILHWRGRAVFADGNNAARVNGTAFTYDVLNAFIDDLAELAGIA